MFRILVSLPRIHLVLRSLIRCLLFPAASGVVDVSSHYIKPDRGIFLLLLWRKAPRMPPEFLLQLCVELDSKCPGIPSFALCNEFLAEGF